MAARASFYAEDQTETSTTSASAQDKVTLTFTASQQVASATYLVIATAQYNCSSASNHIQVKLRDVSGAVDVNAIDIGMAATTDYMSFCGMCQFTAAGTPVDQTYKIQFSVSSGSTAKIKNAAIIIIKLAASDQYFESTGASTTGTTTIHKINTSFTPASTGNYTFIWCCDMSVASTSASLQPKLVVAGTTYNSQAPRAKDTTTTMTGAGVLATLSLANSSQTVTLDFNMSSAVTGTIKNARVAALRWDGFDDAQGVYQNTLQNTNNTVYQDVTGTTLTFTPLAQAYMVLASSVIGTANTSNACFNQVLEGSTSLYEATKTFNASAELWPTIHMRKETEANSSTTWKYQAKRSAGTSANITSNQLSIALIELGTVSAGTNITCDSYFPYSSLTSARNDPAMWLESTGNLKADFSLPLESLATQSADGRELVESLVTATGDGRELFENRGIISGDFGARFEATALLTTDGGIPLAIDGIATGVNISSSSLVLTLSTTKPNDVIIVALDYNNITLNGIADTAGLTWTRRATTGGFQPIDEWYAISPGILTNDVITCTFSGASFNGGCAFGISGANIAAAFDTNGDVPATAASGTITGFSTNASNAIILNYYRQSSIGTPTAGSGYTLLAAPSNGYFFAQYKIVSTAQSNLSFGEGGSTTNTDANGGIADAVIARVGTPYLRFESLSAAQADGQQTDESVATQSADRGMRLESTGLLKSDTPATLESIISVRSDLSQPVEGLATAQGDGREPLESKSIQGADGRQPLESTGVISLTIDGQLPFESTALTKADTSALLEGTGNIRGDAQTPIEGISSTKRDGALPLEALASQRPEYRAPLESSAQQISDNFVPVESVSSARFDANTPVEALTTVRSDSGLLIEGMVRVLRDGFLPFENLTIARTDRVLPLENLSSVPTITSDSMMPFEGVSSVSIDRASPAETVTGLISDAHLWLESSSNLQTGARLPFNSLLSVVSDGILRTELLVTVFADAQSCIEHVASVIGDAVLPLESLRSFLISATPGVRTFTVAQEGRGFTAQDNRGIAVSQENRGFVATDGRVFIVGIEQRNLQ